jgi:hypothetical protein
MSATLSWTGPSQAHRPLGGASNEREAVPVALERENLDRLARLRLGEDDSLQAQETLAWSAHRRRDP